METTIPFEEAIKSFYEFKNKYTESITRAKYKIKNNNALNMQEKQKEYRKFKPLCIHCKRVGGTIFHINYVEDEETVPHRELNAYCGILADPCNLNIKIRIGLYNLYQDRLKELADNIAESKKELIENKNMLLFDFITTEEALDSFQLEKEFINEISMIYEKLLEEYMNKQINIPKIKIEETYVMIEQIKECITKYKEDNSVEYIKDAVNIYNQTLKPKLMEIRKEMYPISYVEYVSATNKYHLIEREPALEMTNMKPLVLKYDILPYKKSTKKPVVEKEKEREREMEE